MCSKKECVVDHGFLAGDCTMLFVAHINPTVNNQNVLRCLTTGVPTILFSLIYVYIIEFWFKCERYSIYNISKIRFFFLLYIITGLYQVIFVTEIFMIMRYSYYLINILFIIGTVY